MHHQALKWRPQVICLLYIQLTVVCSEPSIHVTRSLCLKHANGMGQLSSLPMTLQCSKNFDVGVLSKFSPAVEKQSTVEKAQCCFMNVPKLAGTVLQMIFRRRWRWYKSGWKLGSDCFVQRNRRSYGFWFEQFWAIHHRQEYPGYQYGCLQNHLVVVQVDAIVWWHGGLDTA